jgi:hypothetical protein
MTVVHEINEEGSKNTNVAANNRTLCFATTSSKTDAVYTQQGVGTSQMMTDDRMITAEQLRGKVIENNNLSQQQDDLYNVLIKYQHITKRPGKCTKFEYEFKIQGSIPTSGNSRPIPFALRDQVRDQIQVMVKDEISFSSYTNTLTLVVREKQTLRICVDARRINRQMTDCRPHETVTFARTAPEMSRCKSYYQLGPKQGISPSST